MAALVVRGLFARKTRAALTALAVVLGVAMVAGSYVLTDTINTSFDKIFAQSEAGVDVEVTPHETIKNENSLPPAFSERYVDRVRNVEGVAKAEGGIFDQVFILDKRDKPIQTHGAPNFVGSALTKPFDPFNYVEGHQPTTTSETAIDKFTADRHKFRIGDKIGIAGHGPARHYKLVGIAKFGSVSSFGGASMAVVPLSEAQALTDNAGKIESIEVAAAPGVSPAELKGRVRAVLPKSLDVRTGKEQAQKLSSDIRDNLKFLRVALLAFAGIALLVGAFIIFNTFSITVAQRTKEFAMLRTLGASRRQVIAAVFGEALFIGVAASVVGLFAGIGYAKGIRALFGLIGADLPTTGTVILTRTIIVSLILGTVLTLVASLVPAVRATRVAPLEALRAGTGATPRRSSRLVVLGGVLGVGGVAVMLYALLGVDDSNSALSLIGLGTVAVFLGTALLSPRLVPPVASLAGAPLVKLRGLTGQLARENAMRNPGRTAATAAALMVGLALVTFVAAMAAGLKAGVNNTIDRNFRGDFVLQNKDGFSPIPADVARSVGRIPGVAVAAEWRSTVAKTKGASGNLDVTGLDPRTANSVFEVQWKQGSPATLTSLGPREVVVDKGFAEKHHLRVGSQLSLLTPTARHVTVTVKGSVKDNANFLGDIVMPLQTVAREFGEKRDQVAIVKLAPGADLKRVRRAMDHTLASKFPTVESLNQRELKKNQAKGLNQLLGLVYALLSLAIIVSIFGIVNTLVLTIHERTRELGLLRAVGMSRRQVRTMVRYESVITALIGAVLGAVLGVVFAAVVSRPIADEGFVLKIPIGSIITFLVLAVIAGIAAAIPPARRASRLDVLEALAYE